ncbi:MAG: type II toxin-antitoxin system prevent-host-death family antitoxin [Gemmatimonadota bacterium]|nr:MAG: type II toxin-antitoxin system prevent-host-death family antitoxin [Gemmatimonadota bacterium]
MTTYSTYEAKAKFSEIIRLVREGKTVYITYHGETVAEIRPLSEPQGLAGRLGRLREEGVLQGRGRREGALDTVVRKPGALGRFLAERGE